MLNSLNPWLRSGIKFALVYAVVIAIVLLAQLFITPDDNDINWVVAGLFMITSFPGFFAYVFLSDSGLIDAFVAMFATSEIEPGIHDFLTTTNSATEAHRFLSTFLPVAISVVAYFVFGAIYRIIKNRRKSTPR